MKKFLLSILSVSYFLFTPTISNANENFGIELGYAHLPGFEDEIMDTGQALANALGTTVRVETDTGALVLRGYYNADIDETLGYEIGGFISDDVETKFSTSSASITMTQDIIGFDASLLYEITDGLIIKGGFHSSEVDGAATVTLSGQSATITANDSGTGILIGLETGKEADQFGYSLVYYSGLGGSDDSDATLISATYSF